MHHDDFFEADTDAEYEHCSVTEASHSEPEQPDKGVENDIHVA